ncbi:MAG: calcium-binding protein [Alkalinema sp. FL-bin-369]|nr:calcium-binding protein [Leptolyngbyaceae cyanobacterium LF-bin-369]
MNITTGNGNDTVTRPTSSNNNVYRSDDTIRTNGGNDTINAGLGSDTVYGGDGLDHLILDYSIGDTGTGMIFAGGSQFGTANRKISSTNASYLDSIYFDRIEQFTVTGTSKDDRIDLYTKNSVIKAGAGNDEVNVVYTIDGNIGTLDGGAGFDYLRFNLSNQTANLNLTNLSNINIAGVISATNFERFDITTGSGNDTVIQTGIVNGIVLRANDTINTGDGNDVLSAGLGVDFVNGGGGTDRLIIDYSIGDTGSGMTFPGSNQYGTAKRFTRSSSTTILDSVSFLNIENFTIIGTSKNDTIISSKGSDILTGGAGADTFKYEGLSDSLLGNHDVIKDLAIGTDVIDGPRAVAAAFVKKLGTVIALTESAIQQVLTPTNFESNGASTFKFGNRTFLGLNDVKAGFSASTDSVIEITGYTGNLSNLKIM